MKPWILRPSDDADIRTLLDLAQPGMTVTAWREAGHATLPQANVAERTRIIRETLPLLDIDVHGLAPSAFLSMFHRPMVSAHDRAQLFIARRYARHPWVVTTMRELLLPILVESERPLARTTGAVTEVELDAFLAAHLDPCSATARAGTRRTILRALRLMGVLKSSYHRHRLVRTVTRARLAPLAVAWMIAQQLRDERRYEMMVDEVATSSTAATVYALTRDHVDLSIAEGERTGLLVLSYLAGRPRIMLPNVT